MFVPPPLDGHLEVCSREDHGKYAKDLFQQMAAPVGTKLRLMTAVDKWGLKKGSDVTLVEYRGNVLSLYVEWYLEGTAYGGFGLDLSICDITSTPYGRVQPKLPRSTPGRRGKANLEDFG